MRPTSALSGMQLRSCGIRFAAPKHATPLSRVGLGRAAQLHAKVSHADHQSSHCQSRLRRSPKAGRSDTDRNEGKNCQGGYRCSCRRPLVEVVAEDGLPVGPVKEASRTSLWHLAFARAGFHFESRQRILEVAKCRRRTCRAARATPPLWPRNECRRALQSSASGTKRISPPHGLGERARDREASARRAPRHPLRKLLKWHRSGADRTRAQALCSPPQRHEADNHRNATDARRRGKRHVELVAVARWQCPVRIFWVRLHIGSQRFRDADRTRHERRGQAGGQRWPTDECNRIALA